MKETGCFSEKRDRILPVMNRKVWMRYFMVFMVVLVVLSMVLTMFR